jgi:hypothetical protein
MTRRSVSRRAFLATLGAAGMGSLIPITEAEGQAAGARKRLILLTQGNGTVHSAWKPSASGGALTSLNQCMAALEAHKQDLLVVDGLGWQFGDGPGVDHMRICMMWNGSPMLTGNDFSNSTGSRPCGWGSSISIDQLVANRLAETVTTPFKSLEFGVRLNNHHIYTRVSYAGSNQPIAPEIDPYAMFDRVFANIGEQPSDPAALEAIRLRRKSILDAVKGNLSSVQAKVSTLDRAKIDAHLEAVRSIEKRLDNTVPVASCAPPVLGNKLDPKANDNFPAVSRLQMDLMVAALGCDATRVASLLWAGAANEVRFTWLGQNGGHHTISHDNGDGGKTQRIASHNWFSGEVAYLLEKMKAVPDGAGTLLDNSLVVWGNELSDGAAHSQQPIPIVLAGKAGGAITSTGRLLEFGKQKHNKLLVSIANLMGFDDVTEFGSLDDGSGGLQGLTA